MVAARTYTVEELERNPPPGDWSVNSWELVDGELVVATPTGGESGRVPLTVGHLLSVVVRPRKLGNVYGSSTGFKLFPDRDTMLSPDAAFGPIGCRRLKRSGRSCAWRRTSRWKFDPHRTIGRRCW